MAEIYRQQAMIEKGYEMVGEIITSREARDPKRAAETLEMIGYSSYEGYSYGRMPQLLRFYDEALSTGQKWNKGFKVKMVEHMDFQLI